MARKRTPKDVADITGQTAARPGRYAARKEPSTRPLGDAPDWMRPDQREAFDELKASWPWLQESDRCLIIIGAKLLAAIRADADDKMGVARINQFRLIIAACGGTPTDRSRVSMPTDDVEDPADKFLN